MNSEKKLIRVLHINCNYAITTLHQKLIEALDRKGVQNRVFVPAKKGIKPVIKINKNVILSECFNKWDRVSFDYKQNKIYKALQRTYNVLDFSIIHAYTLFTDGNCADKIKRKYGIPYVVAVRNTDVNVFLKYMFYLRGRGIRILNNASKIFFLSESYKKKVIETYVPVYLREEIRQKSYIIPNGIDEFWLTHLPSKDIYSRRIEEIENGIIRLIYVGRIDRNKNIPKTQAAMEILREEGINVSLSVIGDVSDKTEFEKIQRNPNTNVFSAMGKEKLIEEYRKHSIFVMPSIYETFGLVYAEALSQGLPVIYSRGQGFDGQFPEGAVGYGVSSDSEQEIADAIKKICMNYRVISEETDSACLKFDWDKISEEYVEHYTNILKTPYKE